MKCYNNVARANMTPNPIVCYAKSYGPCMLLIPIKKLKIIKLNSINYEIRSFFHLNGNVSISEWIKRDEDIKDLKRILINGPLESSNQLNSILICFK